MMFSFLMFEKLSTLDALFCNRNGYNMYSKALLANAATSALRLHQRLPRVALTREFFGQLFIEDSAHYLLYSMTFLYCPPITCESHYLFSKTLHQL